MAFVLKRIYLSLRKGRERYSASVSIHLLAVTAVFAAMITIMTAYIFHIPVGMNGGYVHLGDTLIYLAASLLPMPYACAAAAIGGGLADLMTAPVWAPATILIKMLLCLPFSAKGRRFVTRRNIVALGAGFLISTAGYYIAEGILFGFTTSFFTAVIGSVIQSGGSAAAFLLIGTAFDKMNFKKLFFQL